MNLSTLLMSRRGIRTASLTGLISYPLGCLAMLLLPSSLEWIGGIFLGLAVLSFAYTLPSYVRRVAFLPHSLRLVDRECALDELELELRRRAQAFSFQVFSILVVAGIMYLTIASDQVNAGTANMWMPQVDDHWLAILFGTLLFVVLLPVTYLAWRMPEPVIDNESRPEDFLCQSETSPSDTVIINGMTIGFLAGLIFDNLLLWAPIGVGAGFLVAFLMKRRSNTGNRGPNS